MSTEKSIPVRAWVAQILLGAALTAFGGELMDISAKLDGLNTRVSRLEGTMEVLIERTNSKLATTTPQDP